MLSLRVALMTNLDLAFLVTAVASLIVLASASLAMVLN
jgi:hypothetical protein